MINDRGMSEGIRYGYVRVSTKEQNEARQLDALEEYGIPQDRIFMDKQSGKDFNRPAYKKLIRTVTRGDIIVIKSIDRLGRNYQDIIDQWRMITQDIGCGIHVLDMPSLNTSGDPRDLLSRFITDMMLQVLSFVAENERENTKQRQKEGIESAKRRGVKFGRPEATIPKDFINVYIRWKTKETPAMKLVEEMREKEGISGRTFYRRINELDKRFDGLSINQIREIQIEEDLEYEMEKKEAEDGKYTSYNNYRYDDVAKAENNKKWEENKARRDKEKEDQMRKRLKKERLERLDRIARGEEET